MNNDNNTNNQPNPNPENQNPGNAQDTGVEVKQKPTLESVREKRRKGDHVSYQELAELSGEDQNTLAREFAKNESRLKEETNEYKSSFSEIGKLFCLISDRATLVSADAKDFWATVSKGKANGHVMACANVFRTLVLGGMLPEPDYDKNAPSHLESASRTINAVNGVKTHPIMAELVKILKDRASNARKLLQAALNSVKPAEKMGKEDAEETTAKVVADGHMPSLVAYLIRPENVAEFMATLVAECSYVANESVARTLYMQGIAIGDAMARNVDGDNRRRFPTEKLDSWCKEYMAVKKPAVNGKPQTEKAPETTSVGA